MYSNCYSIKANALAMVIDVVVAHDGCAHRALSDMVSNKTLRDLVTRELFAEGKVGSTITKVTIAVAMDGVKSGADIVFGEDGNRVLRGGVSRR